MPGKNRRSGRPVPFLVRAALVAVGGFAFLCTVKAITIRFVDPVPTVLVNQPKALQVEISYPEGAVDTGLFSYGIAVLPDGLLSDIHITAVQVPSQLDYNGIAGVPALSVLQPDLAAVKGTINLGEAFAPYTGTLLATFTFQSDQLGLFPLRLDLFNTLGPTEQIFVSGEGVVLDDLIVFEGTTVEVLVPEPTTLVFLACGVAGLACRRQRAASRTPSGPVAGRI